jgi:hypothetical protein
MELAELLTERPKPCASALAPARFKANISPAAILSLEKAFTRNNRTDQLSCIDQYGNRHGRRKQSANDINKRRCGCMTENATASLLLEEQRFPARGPPRTEILFD